MNAPTGLVNFFQWLRSLEVRLLAIVDLPAAESPNIGMRFVLLFVVSLALLPVIFGGAYLLGQMSLRLALIFLFTACVGILLWDLRIFNHLLSHRS